MHDVVIIGGGHNNLVCSAYLAMAGFKLSCSINVPWSEAPLSRKNSAQASPIRLHRTPSEPEDHRRPQSRRPWIAHRRASDRQLSTIR